MSAIKIIGHLGFRRSHNLPDPVSGDENPSGPINHVSPSVLGAHPPVAGFFNSDPGSVGGLHSPGPCCRLVGGAGTNRNAEFSGDSWGADDDCRQPVLFLGVGMT